MSAVREAIKAVLEEVGVEERGFLLFDLAEQIAKSVERVPVNVTIRDLDMEPENVLTIDGDELAMVGGDFYEAHESGRPLHLAVDGGFLKTKIGNGMWSPPVATEVYTG